MQCPVLARHQPPRSFLLSSRYFCSLWVVPLMESLFFCIRTGAGMAAPNQAVELTAGSHSRAAAAHRQRTLAVSVKVCSQGS